MICLFKLISALELICCIFWPNAAGSTMPPEGKQRSVSEGWKADINHSVPSILREHFGFPREKGQCSVEGCKRKC